MALSAAVLATLQGCNTSGCLENQNSLPLAGFYSDRTKEAITVDSIEIGGVGAPNDSLLNKTPRVSEIYLPFRSAMTSTSFYFRYTSRQLAAAGISDTVTFDYTSEPRFVSEDCGAMYYYRITRVRHTSDGLIDSVGIAPTDSLVTNTDIQRIRIYFKTAEPTEPEE